jgi:hypothetical protein
MRWLPPAIVLAAHVADARPIRHFDGDDDFYLEKRKPTPVCKPTADWKKFARCNFNREWKIEMLHDLPGAKLIAIEYAPNSHGRKQLAIYLLAKTWIKAAFYLERNPQLEVLGFAPLADAYRLDLGSATSTWVSLDETTPQPAMLRRTFTYVCDRTGYCRSVTSSCDVLVRGKAVATFRGEVRWNGKELKLRGDGRSTNRYCPLPPKGVMDTE